MFQPNPPPPLLLRPAVIELRFTDEGNFTRAVTAYKTMLANEGKPGLTTNVYNFKVGKNNKKQDILLRLTWGQEPESTANRTIVYWEVSGKWNKNLYASRDKLTALGLREIEKPDSTNPRSMQIADLGNPLASGLNDRSLVSDGAANQMGITINPPVPTFTRGPGDGDGFTEKIHSAGWLLLGALILGFGLGLLLHWGATRRGRAATSGAARPNGAG